MLIFYNLLIVVAGAQTQEGSTPAPRRICLWKSRQLGFFKFFRGKRSAWNENQQTC